jgi:hypothetical protein
MNPFIADTEAEGVTVIVLPFPHASLSGHNNGTFWSKAPEIRRHREWACLATFEARPALPADGDIRLHVRFIPPDNRGDRTNYWNRCKPYFDGIASALKVNDKRFLPSMSFGAPEKPGRVEVTLG